MKLFMASFAAFVLSLGALQAAAQEKAADSAAKPKLKVLYITGGGYHKYDILTPDHRRRHQETRQCRYRREMEPRCHATKNSARATTPSSTTSASPAIANRPNCPRRPTRISSTTPCASPRKASPPSWSTAPCTPSWPPTIGPNVAASGPEYTTPTDPFGTEKVTADHPAIKHFPDRLENSRRRTVSDHQLSRIFHRLAESQKPAPPRQRQSASFAGPTSTATAGVRHHAGPRYQNRRARCLPPPAGRRPALGLRQTRRRRQPQTRLRPRKVTPV